MSNFFEQELRKLFEDGKVIHAPVFVGRACVGGLDAGRQVRAEFVTMGHADHYESLRLTLLDNDLGVVDKLTLRLKDVWGKKAIPNNPYLKSGVDPHIWVNDGKVDWYAYHPTQADYQQLRQAAGSYLDTFRGQTKAQEHSPKLVYICAPLRALWRKTSNLPGRKPRRCSCRGMCRYAHTSCFRPLPTLAALLRIRRHGTWACAWWRPVSRSMCMAPPGQKGCGQRSGMRRSWASLS